MFAEQVTAAELARRSGLDYGTVSDFISGKRWPRTDTLAAIEKALDLQPGEIEGVIRGRGPASVSPSGQGGAMLDLPPAIFEGMSTNQIDELIANIRAEAWKRRREIMGE